MDIWHLIHKKFAFMDLTLMRSLLAVVDAGAITEAAERLGVQTGEVTEAAVSRQRTLQGEVVALTLPSGRGAVVKVSNGSGPVDVSPGQSVRVRPMVHGADGWPAQAVDDGDELQYVVKDAEGLVPGQRVGVEEVAP